MLSQSHKWLDSFLPPCNFCPSLIHGGLTASHNRHGNGWVNTDARSHTRTHTATRSENRNVYRLTSRPQAFSEPRHKDHHFDSAFPSKGSFRHWLYAICLCVYFACVWEQRRVRQLHFILPQNQEFSDFCHLFFFSYEIYPCSLSK